eukprot:9199481-Alexandrium_andersonii.AAC.1
MVATLSTPGQVRVKRGRTSREEVDALVEQRSVESTVARIARQEADASSASVARAQAAQAERTAGEERPEELAAGDRVRLSSSMRKLAECRDRVLAVRIQRETAGAIRSRSQRFLAEYRAIKRGDSAVSVWQALQKEKQFQRNR